MRIENIILSNYRLYKGNNKIEFASDDSGKNIYLVSGQNGFGKTTFLQSLLWCLYGKLIADIDETLKKEIANSGGYNAFLIKNLNITARQQVEEIKKEDVQRIKRNGYAPSDKKLKENAIYSVSIHFGDVAIPSIPCKTFTVIRSYDFIKAEEKLDVLIDGKENELARSIGNDVFVNDFILSKDIARFFFFDSERIVALAETNTIEEKRKLASAYNEVLGVKKYEDLKHNLESIRLRFRKRTSDVASRNKLLSLIDKQKLIQVQIEDSEQRQNELNSKIQNLRVQNDALQEKLLREGQGISMDEYRKSKLILESAKDKDATLKASLKDFIELAPFAIVGKLFTQAKDQVIKDYDFAKVAQNIVAQNHLLEAVYSDLIEKLSTLKSVDGKTAVQKMIRSVLDNHKEEEVEHNPLMNVPKSVYQDFIAVYNNLTSTYKIEFEHLADDYKKNRQLLSRTAQKLSSMSANESDALIQQIRDEKNLVEQEIAQCEQNIRSTYELMGSLQREAAIIKKQISELSKKVSLDDSDAQKDALADQLINELDTFLKALKKEKKTSLEVRLKHIMNSLMHKEDFISSVSVNVLEDGLDIDLIASDGTIIRKDTLSKGEQQLYATSLLKALVEESGIDFPVFIDSPLQKFDKSHSNKIITKFYPSISKQVVLFPLLHKELTEQEMDIMQPLVKATYLIKNATDRSYFEEVSVNELMSY